MIRRTTRLVMGVAAVSAIMLSSYAYGATATSVILSEAGGVFPADIFLEDNDKTYAALDNGPGGVGPADRLLNTGDILRGMINVQLIDGPAPGTTSIGAGTAHNELTGVYDLLVTATWAPGAAGNPVPGFWSWLFGPDPAFGTYAGDVFGVPVPAGAMIMMSDDPAKNYTDDTGAAGSEEGVLIPTAANGPFWAAFGTGPRPALEYWNTFSVTNSLAAMEAGPAQGYGPAGALGQYQISMIPTGLGVAESLLVPTASGVEMEGSLAIYGRMNPSTGLPVFTNFDFGSDTDAWIAIVPLPAAVWAGMPLLGFAVLAKRRLFH